MKTYLLIICSFFMISISGCATQSSPSVSNQSSKKEHLSSIYMPSLKIVVDCGECEVNSKVSQIIIDSYIAKVASEGKKISVQETVTLTINDYSDRNFIKRFALGPASILFFKDEIMATLNVNKKDVVIEENARVPLRGIESVAEKVGEATYFAVLQ